MDKWFILGGTILGLIFTFGGFKLLQMNMEAAKNEEKILHKRKAVQYVIFSIVSLIFSVYSGISFVTRYL